VDSDEHVERESPEERRTWSSANFDLLADTLKRELHVTRDLIFAAHDTVNELGAQPQTIRGDCKVIPENIDRITNNLVESIQKSLMAAVPVARLSGRSIPGFPRELKELSRLVKKQKRHAINPELSSRHREQARKKYKSLKLELKKNIRRFRRSTWRT
jgi:hypothetical protein